MVRVIFYTYQTSDASAGVCTCNHTYQMEKAGKNLLHSDLDKGTSKFMDNIYSNSFFPKINLLTRITASSKTLIDNIFYNDICKKIKAGNIATTKSDHLTQFLAIPSKETTLLSTYNIMKPSSLKILTNKIQK